MISKILSCYIQITAAMVCQMGLIHVPGVRNSICYLLNNSLHIYYKCYHQKRIGTTTNKLKPPPPPSNFIAGRPKVALLFWFFGGVRCGVPLFIVILVIY